MKSLFIAVTTLVALMSGPIGPTAPAESAPQRPAVTAGIQFGASPNPAVHGQLVTFSVGTDPSVTSKLQVWIAAGGAARPDLGTLPPGSWSYECCPAQTRGGPAWHYRPYAPSAGGTFRFHAVARTPGSWTNGATFAGVAATLTLRVL